MHLQGRECHEPQTESDVATVARLTLSCALPGWHMLLPADEFDGLQHKGPMSTKPVFKKIAKTQMSYVQLCGHTIFVLLHQHVL